MKKKKYGILMIIAMLCAAAATQASLDLSNFSIIGYTNNAMDTTSKGTRGAVGYVYGISKTAVSVGEWAQFYTAFSSVGGVGTLNSAYTDWYASAGGNSAPAARMSYHQAAMYCNWLTTGSAISGVYTISSSGTVSAIDRTYRNTDGIAYVLPTRDEWHKAAFFKADGSGYSDYTDGSDVAPALGTQTTGYYYGNLSSTRAVDAGAVEQNGTYNMMGTVWEWTETKGSTAAYQKGGRSSPVSAAERSGTLTEEGGADSFRIAVIGAIPEPATIGMLGLGGLIAFLLRRIRS